MTGHCIVLYSTHNLCVERVFIIMKKPQEVFFIFFFAAKLNVFLKLTLTVEVFNEYFCVFISEKVCDSFLFFVDVIRLKGLSFGKAVNISLITVTASTKSRGFK